MEEQGVVALCAADKPSDGALDVLSAGVAAGVIRVVPQYDDIGGIIPEDICPQRLRSGDSMRVERRLVGGWVGGWEPDVPQMSRWTFNASLIHPCNSFRVPR